jgi:hypothetical protein
MRLSIFAKKLLSAKFGQGLILLWPFSERDANVGGSNGFRTCFDAPTSVLPKMRYGHGRGGGYTKAGIGA